MTLCQPSADFFLDIVLEENQSNMCGKRRNLLHSGRRTSVQLIRNKIFVSKEFDIFLQKKIGYKKMDAFGVREILAKKCFTKMSPPVA